MKVNCIIIDDEQIARDIVKDYINLTPELKLDAEFENAIEAIPFLQENKIDLIFLDINMPKLSGLDFIRTLQSPPKIILTTAYREYALDGFELNVADYLLKPFSFQRFTKAIQHYYNIVNSNKVNSTVDFIFVRYNRKQIKILYNDILYIKSNDEYIEIITITNKYMIKGSLSKMGKLLPKELFIRIHNSYIVSIKNITSITSNDIEINGIEIPISRKYKSDVFRALGL